MVSRASLLVALLSIVQIFAFTPTTRLSRKWVAQRAHGQWAMEIDSSKIKKDTEQRMQKSIESMKGNLNTVRTGRANPGMLDRLMVNYYGTPTPINQVARITTTGAMQLTLEPFDREMLNSCEACVMEANLGISPQSDGTVLRLNLPSMTEDRRKEMVKHVKTLGEEGKVAVRNIRRDVVEKVKKAEKAKEISEDGSKNLQTDIQKLTDKYTKQIEEVTTAKEKEVLTV